MNDCEKYLEMISAMIDGELSADERAELMTHVSACSSCRSVLSAFTALAEEFRSPEPVPAGLCAAVMEKVRQPQGRVIPWRRWAALAACLALVCTAGLHIWSNRPLWAGNQVATTMGELCTAPEIMSENADASGYEAEYAVSKFAMAPVSGAAADAGTYIDAVMNDTANYVEASLLLSGNSYDAPDSDTQALLQNLIYAEDAEAPESAPEYTLELSAGNLVELWDTDQGIICRLDGYSFIPAGSSETILELVHEITQ